MTQSRKWEGGKHNQGAAAGVLRGKKYRGISSTKSNAPGKATTAIRASSKQPHVRHNSPGQSTNLKKAQRGLVAMDPHWVLMQPSAGHALKPQNAMATQSVEATSAVPVEDGTAPAHRACVEAFTPKLHKAGLKAFLLCGSLSHSRYAWRKCV